MVNNSLLLSHKTNLLKFLDWVELIRLCNPKHRDFVSLGHPLAIPIYTIFVGTYFKNGNSLDFITFENVLLLISWWILSNSFLMFND